MNNALLREDVQAYLQEHQLLKPSELALMKSPFADVSSAELAGQLDGWQRSTKKLPLWHQTAGIYFPSKLAMEQCSSEQTAKYKAGLLPANARGADLTGGFGVDSYCFSTVSREVIHCEINPELSQIVRHNNAVLAAGNIRSLAVDGLVWLYATPETFDYLYIDPSRRVNERKVFTLDETEPAILQHQDLLLQKSPLLIIKAAPLLDITAAINQLKHVAEVHVISTGNECKELLFIQRCGYAGPVSIHCVLLGQGTQQVFSFDPDHEKAATSSFGPLKQYLYEPDVALLKAGCFKSPGVFYSLDKIHRHTHLYTSDLLNPAFPGRVFVVKEVQDYGSFKKSKTVLKANIAVRNFPLTTQQLGKKHNIRDGGGSYLFFVTDYQGNLKVIFTEKVIQDP